MNLSQQSASSPSTLNELYINSLAYLENSDENNLELDSKYYNFLYDQKNYI